MTDRLYYDDPYLTDFEADILEIRDVGGRRAVLLDRTAFYPTSGGQPFDTGALGNARVVDVLDEEDGRIVHLVAGDPGSGRVSGRVDWGRRFEHMQQHTGQHVLSAAFDRLFGVRTASFHLGSSASTIDLAREVTPGEIARAEDAANDVVWSDRPVTIRFVEPEEAAALPLRKEPVRTGRLRIIDIEGIDVSACGGTHVRCTGAVGIIAVSSWERFRGGSRIEFRCGGRVLGAHRLLRDAVSASIQLISVAPEELPQGIERLQTENKESRRRAKELETRLARYEADALTAKAATIGGTRVVLETLADFDINGLKTIAQTIAGQPGYAAVLCTATRPSAVIIARGPHGSWDAAALLKHLMAAFGGKGGGRPELAQGAGLDASPQDILAAARSYLT